jgi:hypothetical protein
VSSAPIELTITETSEADVGFVIDAKSDADARRFVPVALILERAFARHAMGAIGTFDSAVIRKDDDGKVRITKTRRKAAREGDHARQQADREADRRRRRGVAPRDRRRSA